MLPAPVTPDRSTARLGRDYHQALSGFGELFDLMRVWWGGSWAAVLLGGVVCLPLMAQTGSQQPARNGSVEDLFRQGAAAMHSGRTAEAERSFREAVRLQPGMADAHLDLGLVLGREGKTEEAIAELRRALELNPKVQSGHMFLGIFLYQTGHADEAIRELEAEIALAPANAEALTWMGIAELSSGHPEKATGPLDRAAELDPENLDLLEYRGKAHSQVAEASYARMAKIAPDSWHVHRVRGQLLSGESKHAEAIAEFEAAVKQEPRNPDLWESLGDEYRKSSQLDKAQTAYAKELELTPRNPIAMYDLGSTDVERGEAAAGVPLLEAMLQAYSGSAVAEYYLGRGLADTGKNDEAAGWLEKSAAADGSGEVAKRSFYELARIYRKMQRPEQASKALAEYTRLREAGEKQSAAEVQDWRKLSAGPAASQ